MNTAKSLTNILVDKTNKITDNTRRKWNEFRGWVTSYHSGHDTDQVIEELRNHVREVLPQIPDLTPVERERAVRGYFRTYTILIRLILDPYTF